MDNSKIHHHKVLELPSPLEADSVYYVKNGDAFDVYVTNNSGMIVGVPHKKTEVLNTFGDSPTSTVSQVAITHRFNSVETALGAKVDKVAGKGLSDNDYTNADKTKLDNIENEATKNNSDSFLLDRANHTGYQPITSVTGLETDLSNKVTKITGKGLTTNDFTDVLKSKLDAIAANATANSTDAQLRDRATHTGTQAIATIDGLEARLGSVEGGNFSEAYRVKLDGIAVNATKNLSDAHLLSRSNHTGTQPVSSITGLPFQSQSDFPNGTFIYTNIPSGGGDSFTLEIRGKGYGGVPHHVMCEAYQYDGGFTSVSGVNYSGNIFNISVMDYDGVVCFWFPPTGYWNSFLVECRLTTRENQQGNRVMGVSDAGKPAGQNTIDIQLVRTHNTSNQLSLGTTPASAKTALELGTAATANIDWLLAQNVASASTLAGDQTNWANYRGYAVANMLGWNNYGNGHVIFDASSGTSPTGVAVDNKNAHANWSSSLPTLMGWNGNNTFGVRVDSARTADTVDGLPPHYERNNLANRLVRTNASGYLDTGYINIDIGIEDPMSVAEIYVGNGTDQYLRKVSKAHFKEQMGITDGGGMADYIDLGTNPSDFAPVAGKVYKVSRTALASTLNMACTQDMSKISTWYLVVSRISGSSPDFIPNLTTTGLTNSVVNWSGGGSVKPSISGVVHVMISCMQIEGVVRATIVDGW